MAKLVEIWQDKTKCNINLKVSSLCRVSLMFVVNGTGLAFTENLPGIQKALLLFS